MRRIILILGVFSGWQISFGHAREQLPVVDQSFQITLSQNAVDLLAQHIHANHLQNEQNVPLEDTEDSTLGIRFKTEDAQYSLNYDALKLEIAEDQSIRVLVDLSDVKIQLKRMRFSKKVFGSELSSVCEDTTIQFAHENPIQIRATLNLQNQDRALKSSIENVDFKLKSENFRIGGPRKCSGKLGIGYLIRGATRLILDQSYGQIAKKIRESIANAGPRVGEELTQMLSRQLDFDLANVLPSFRENSNPSPVVVRVQTFPHDVQIKNQSIQIIFGTTWPMHRKHLAGASKFSRDDESKDENQDVKIGINPDLIKSFFEASLVSAGGEIIFPILSAETPLLGEILSRDRLANIWPELLQRDLSSEHLLVQLALLEAPEVLMSREKPNEMKIVFPKIAIRFWTFEKTEKTLFFTIHTRMEFAVKPEISEGYLSFTHTAEPQIQLSGTWGENVHPQIDLFEQDQAMVLASSAVQYFRMQELRWPLPALTLGESPWDFSESLVWNGQFLELSIRPK